MSDNYLLDAIDALTLPRTVRIVQPDPKGSGIECVADGVEDAPIVRLREAIAGNTGSHAGSSDPRTRIPLDPGALGLYNRIEERILEWYVGLLKTPPHLLPEKNLREWYRGIRYGLSSNVMVDEGLEAEVTRQVTSWVRQIGDMFDPPIRLEVTRRVQIPLVSPRTGERLYWPDGSLRVRLSTQPAHCPRCDQATARDPGTGDQTTALIIEYRQSQIDQALEAAAARCRSCESTWTGELGIRELRRDIDAWEERHLPV